MNPAPFRTADPAMSEPGLAFSAEETAASAALARLIMNLPGFVYRCRPDGRRTMEFVSERCRDLTGYDPHRLYGNESLTYGLLIHPDDRERVESQVLTAARRGRQFTACYRLLAAFGRTVPVVDRGIGVLDESGALVAIEGYVSRANADWTRLAGTPVAPDQRG